MSLLQIFSMIAVCALCTFLTRALPFLIFKDAQRMPKSVAYVAGKLPMAIMTLLVLYCVRNTAFTNYPYGLPEFCCIILVILLHVWKRNMLLSIAIPTFLYMVFIQYGI